MCYFARKDFSCKDWRWGNMVERCPRQHRIGETCGAKLVSIDHIETRLEPCKTCQEIQVKERRLQKVRENISRWTAEKGRFVALLEKAENERDQLKQKIQELHSQRSSVVFEAVGGRSAPGLPPPSTMLPMATDPTYTWSAQPPPRGYNTSGQMASGYASINPAAARGNNVTVPEAASNRHKTPYTPYSSRR